MDPDLSSLDDHLADRGVEGYLVDADSTVADQYYLSGFDAPDPFVTLYDGAVHVLVNRGLEYGRAQREARARSVARTVDYDLEAYAEDHGAQEARWHALADFLADYDVGSVAVPPRFPLATADGLRDQGVTVAADHDGVLTEIRATKTQAETDHVRAAQAANEAAMAAAEALLGTASVDAAGHLVVEGDVLTSERVKRAIEMELLREGCALDETIVACGAQAADPHDRGSGPLAAGEPIIVDIFPRDKTTRYHADMTRTFCVGEPSETLRTWYDLTQKAHEAALDAIEPGTTGAAVHDAVCDVYEEAGLPTLRRDETEETGFIHSTGHGVGLDVHELPRLGPNGGELAPGHVVTVEPGLYDPAVGGVRIEDLVVVTETGHENLTDYPKSLVL
jgi:Xaa-Pro aminopeptidase